MTSIWQRKFEINRRALLKSAALFASGFGAKWLVDRAAYGDAPLLEAISPPASESPAAGGPFIDVREFKKTMTVEELCRTSEQYFAVLDNWNSLLAKPLSDIQDAPNLLNNFAQVLVGLRLVPGMSVLDFGAGSCWASHWLTQLGMEAIALDVSRTALKIGQALYARQPVFGTRPAPRFLPFDGHRIELADASVDRILCFDTFHHILNPAEVLREMSRVLKPGGIAGFSEPGPHHSLSPQSQYEMRNFKVLEGDIHVREIWADARHAGFARMSLAVFSAQPTFLGLASFEDYLDGGPANQQFADATRSDMKNRRLFFLQNGGEPPPLDSRSRAGLHATLQIDLSSSTAKPGAPLAARAVVTNSGRAIWLPRSAKAGAVLLGCHLLDASGKMLKTDFFRAPLTPGDGRPLAPGESVMLDLRLPPLEKGDYILEFDLVSESISWFAINGSEVVRRNLRVD
jgi:SAM-dependent methyltransferase